MWPYTIDTMVNSTTQVVKLTIRIHISPNAVLCAAHVVKLRNGDIPWLCSVAWTDMIDGQPAGLFCCKTKMYSYKL